MLMNVTQFVYFVKQRPWSQFDSNFQIMFKVGMGETPDAPPTLSQEGHDFLDHCLQVCFSHFLLFLFDRRAGRINKKTKFQFTA